MTYSFPIEPQCIAPHYLTDTDVAASLCERQEVLCGGEAKPSVGRCHSLSSPVPYGVNLKWVKVQ